MQSAEGAVNADLPAQLGTALRWLSQPGLVDLLQRARQSIPKGVESGPGGDALLKEDAEVDVGGGLTVPVGGGRLTVMELKRASTRSRSTGQAGEPTPR